MSRSYTSRPSVANTRGRGTQTRNPTGPMQNQQTGPTGRGKTTGASRFPGTTAPPQGASQPVGQRMTHQGAYTMITPNERKRQQITEMAQQEEAAYEAHKERNTQKQLNYVGTVGGGQMTQAGARRQTVQQSPTKTGRLLEQQHRKSSLKQKEDEELQKKKAVQRLKTQQNAERQQRDATNWDEQRRRTNEAFLRRLENKSKPTDTGTPPDDPVQPPADKQSFSNHQSGTSRSSIGQSDVRPANQEPVFNELANRGAVGGATGNSNSVQDSQQSSNNRLSVEEQKRLSALAMIFPQIEETVLIEILQQVGFSVDSAITLLQG